VLIIIGRTALHIAAAYGHEEIVNLILERGGQLADKMDVDKVISQFLERF
jgi:ankyrin repeat protein